jgi:hypothetical protein
MIFEGEDNWHVQIALDVRYCGTRLWGITTSSDCCGVCGFLYCEAHQILPSCPCLTRGRQITHTTHDASGGRRVVGVWVEVLQR